MPKVITELMDCMMMEGYPPGNFLGHDGVPADVLSADVNVMVAL